MATLFLLAVASQAAAPLNIVLMVADDVGWGDFGFHGSTIATPSLDRLAREGVPLERFYVNPICSVTRAALMTGQFTRRTGVNNRTGLPIEYRLLPEDFQAAGWQTWMCGKWHLGGSPDNVRSGREYQPDRRGFDQFYGFLGGAVDYNSHINRETGGLDWWRNGEPAKDTGYSTDLLAGEAIRLIQNRDKTRPFLLYLAFNAAHGPLNPPPGTSPGRGGMYGAVVTHLDAAVGRVLDTLEQERLSGSTLVLFFCDNGAQEGRGGSNAPLRGWKGEARDGGVRSAAILRGPGLKGGTRSEQWMWVGDLWPTLAAAAGLKPRPTQPFDGVNVWPALTQGVPMDRAPFEVGARDLAWITPPWKLIRAPDGSQELYQLDDDPRETTDLARLKPELVSNLSGEWANSMGATSLRPAGGKGRKAKTQPLNVKPAQP